MSPHVGRYSVTTLLLLIQQLCLLANVHSTSWFQKLGFKDLQKPEYAMWLTNAYCINLTSMHIDLTQHNVKKTKQNNKEEQNYAFNQCCMLHGLLHVLSIVIYNIVNVVSIDPAWQHFRC